MNKNISIKPKNKMFKKNFLLSEEMVQNMNKISKKLNYTHSEIVRLAIDKMYEIFEKEYEL